ncbi:glycosyltransferase family 2 protein [bacterium]|nr:glycosyltransferase family 2 protein [bacterium]
MNLLNFSKKRSTLSVVIIAKDEEARIAECLRSVDFADEVIVADTGSHDATPRICTALGARVEHIPFTGYGSSKQRAIGFASSEWILSLDADERVTPELRAEIEDVLTKRFPRDGYAIPRLTWLWGKAITHGGWYPDRLLRLFQHGKGNFTTSPIHERVVINGKMGHLKSPIHHKTDDTFQHYLAKLNHFSTLSAQQLAGNSSKKVGVWQGLSRALLIFVKMYIVKSGWRDGIHGGLLAGSSAYSTFLKYTKAAMIREGNKGIFLASTLKEEKQ